MSISTTSQIQEAIQRSVRHVTSKGIKMLNAGLSPKIEARLLLRYQEKLMAKKISAAKIKMIWASIQCKNWHKTRAKKH